MYALLFRPMPSLAIKYLKGDGNVSKIAITMDDCHRIDYVEAMLDLCEKYNFRMTFFPIGEIMDIKDREIWLRLLEDGHEIGNHTMKHKNLTKYDQRQVTMALKSMEKQLDDVLGFHYPITLMRPPFGAVWTNATDLKIVNSGYPYIILWSISSTSPDKVLRATQNGSILLFHARKKDIDCLAIVIPELQAKDFELVTVSELLELPSS